MKNLRSHLDIVLDGTRIYIHERAVERAETLGLGDSLGVAHCVHSLDGHTRCSKGMRLCTDLIEQCPFEGRI